MSGFRLHINDFVVSDTTEGSTVENGKITNSNGTYGYTHDADGVKRCLLDLCEPLMTKEGNGYGWELNTELCPDNTPVLMKDSLDVYGLFFKNTTVHKNLMILLPLHGYMQARYSTQQTSKQNYGFPGYEISPKSYAYSSDSEVYMYSTDICMSMTYTDSDVWDLSHRTCDSEFYPSNRSPVIFLATCNYTSNYTTDPRWSLVGKGTSDTYTLSNNNANSGPMLGKSCRYMVLFDEFGNIGIGASYNKMLPSLAFVGDFYSSKLEDQDNRPTSLGGYFSVNPLDGCSIFYTGAGTYASNHYTDAAGQATTRFKDFQPLTGVPSDYYMSESTPPHMSIVNPTLRVDNYNYKTAHQLYTKNGYMNPDIIRGISPSSITFGQTYSNKQWCCISHPIKGSIPTAHMLSATMYNNYNYSDDSLSYPLINGILIHWDGEYNGIKTIV